MAKEEKQQEVTLEDLQKQIADVTKEVTSLKEENTSLKEQLTQKDLQISKLTLGAVEKKVSKEEKTDEEVSFDFDF